MAIYDLNLFQKVSEWLPPDKRMSRMIQWLRSLVAPIQSLIEKYLNDYRVGNIYPTWAAGTYNTGDKVVYKTSIYECIADGVTTTPPQTGWRLFLSSFVGTEQRILFNGQKVVLEYALNAYYQTIFRQPNLVSDIYIGNVPKRIVGFVVGETIGDLVSQTDTAGKPVYNSFLSYSLGDIVKFDGRMYVSLANTNVSSPLDETKWQITETINFDNPFQYVYNFNINVPFAVYTSSSPNIEKEMRAIVDKIIPYSINYSITPY
jgi:hypothetical protein